MDILNEGGGGSPEPRPTPEPPGRRKIVCEFCDCEVGVDGSYKKLSDKAKSFRDQEERIEALNKTLGEKDREIAALKAQIPAPPANPRAGERRGGVLL
jgi:hypothetical protein